MGKSILSLRGVSPTFSTPVLSRRLAIGDCREVSGWIRPKGFTTETRNPKPETLNCNGFTLIEVLVALTLLAVALTTLIELFSGSLSLAHSSRIYTTAVFLANQKMGETLLATDTPLDSGDFEIPYDNFSYNVEVGTQELSKWQVNEVDEMLTIISEGDQTPPSSGLRKIRVTVTWEDNQRERSLRLETLQAIVIKPEIEE